MTFPRGRRRSRLRRMPALYLFARETDNILDGDKGDVILETVSRQAVRDGALDVLDEFVKSLNIFIQKYFSLINSSKYYIKITKTSNQQGVRTQSIQK